MAQDGYPARSKAFLAGAKEDLAKGQTAAASEKLWSAAYQMLKAVAQHKGWPYNSYRQLFEAVVKLVEETGDSDYTVVFHAAAGLHTNYSEDWEPRLALEGIVPAIERFTEKLEALLAEPAAENPPEQSTSGSPA